MKTFNILPRVLLLCFVLATLPGCGSDDAPTAPAPAAPAVLVLSDGATEVHVSATLKAAGFDVRDGGLFYEFTGAGLETIDAVVLLTGKDYNNDMDDRGEAGLAAFVAQGGGLITTEWLNYSIDRSNYHQLLKPVVPVSYGGSYAGGSETYSVVTDHPVTAGLPATFTTPDDNQFSVVAPKTGATQLVRGDRSGAAVVTWTQGGRVVSWNMAGEYGGPDVWNADMDQLLVNAVGYVAGGK